MKLLKDMKSDLNGHRWADSISPEIGLKVAVYFQATVPGRLSIIHYGLFNSIRWHIKRKLDESVTRNISS